MATYDTIKTKMVRQELQLIEAGQHYKIYSAKVRNLPENIEKEDFFQLCYGMLNKCDELNIYTFKKGEFEILYKFIVVNVNIDEKIVDVRLVSKVDFTEDPTEALQGDTLSLEDVTRMVKKLTKGILESIAVYQGEIDATIEELSTKVKDFIAITGETDKEAGDNSSEPSD